MFNGSREACLKDSFLNTFSFFFFFFFKSESS